MTQEEYDAKVESFTKAHWRSLDGMIQIIGRFDPATDRNHLAEVEAEIERRGLAGDYIHYVERWAFFRWADQAEDGSLDKEWFIRTIPPDVAARIALAALEGRDIDVETFKSKEVE